MRARAAALAAACTVVVVGCSGGSLARPPSTSPTTTTSPPVASTTTAPSPVTTIAALPVPTRPATTTTPTSLDIPAGASAIAVASHDEVVAVIGKGTWDDALPVPQAGLAKSSWSPDDDHGGTLVLAVPATAADTAGFFRLQLSQRGFQFTEERAGTISTFKLGPQATIAVSPTTATACSVTMTVTL